MREVAAAALGATLRWADAGDVVRVLAALTFLTEQDQWEVRQGGYLGLQQLIAAQPDLAPAHLPLVVARVVRGSVLCLPHRARTTLPF